VAKKGPGPKKVKLLVATRNSGKFREFRHYLAGLGLELVSLKHFPGWKESSEPFASFEENARHKALDAYRRTGLMALADDSGLELDALEGAPGARSARFAGKSASDEENNCKLLRLLKGVPAKKRTARFRCVLALAVSEKQLKMVEGVARGFILLKPRGQKGFGYDPLFYEPRVGRTFSEMGVGEKLKVSHRGEALRKLRPVLKSLAAKLKARKA